MSRASRSGHETTLYDIIIPWALVATVALRKTGTPNEAANLRATAAIVLATASFHVSNALASPLEPPPNFSKPAIARLLLLITSSTHSLAGPGPAATTITLHGIQIPRRPGIRYIESSYRSCRVLRVATTASGIVLSAFLLGAMIAAPLDGNYLETYRDRYVLWMAFVLWSLWAGYFT
ncbi:hypothetical protein EXIGLDRAFT_762418 [Exidia glandulosa HHB12029]|uniref:Uncharacterized protein n=1 Tax=Exidia glandulosa HHB12029 TaxID=1314781 RepID=A0A166BBY2_EXIGL|nr:hypothetical protein EXIGLDRAFT_762418 [Exidia glandulosa HHB12029]